VGEDAGTFSLQEQKLKVRGDKTHHALLQGSKSPPMPLRSWQDWGIFTVLLVTVLGALYVLWIDPATGFGDEYLTAVESISNSPEVRGPWGPFNRMVRVKNYGI
jgi:hypothetical protein